MPIPDDIPIVPDIDARQLNRLQVDDYRHHRCDILTWLSTRGKSPDERDGYSRSVVENTAYRLSKIYRWEWDRRGYTIDIGHDVADEYVQHIAKQDWGNENKSQYVKALKRLMKWRVHELGDEPWAPELSFAPRRTEYAPQDYLSLEKRRAVHEDALSLGSIPSYHNVSPETRSRINRYLAQRFEMPMSEVGPNEWDRANSWKIPSLVWTSLDAGLRPIEVERSRVEWIDTSNAVLRIPKDQSSKNRMNWIVSLREQTARALDRWTNGRQNRNTTNLTPSGSPHMGTRTGANPCRE